MKQLTLLLLTAFMSCNSSTKKKETPKEGVSFIVGTFIQPTGEKVIEVLGRKITKGIQYDSISQRDLIKIDTQYFKPVWLPIKDSLGHTVMDTLTHQPRQYKDYYIISRDSINTHIENIPVSELLKK